MVVREARAPARDEVEERGWRERHRRVARAAVEHGRLVSRVVPRLSAVASIMVRGGDVRRDGKRSERRLGGTVRRFRPGVLSSSLCHSGALVISSFVAFVFVVVSWGRVQFFGLREGLSLNRKRRRLERERSRVERVGPRGRRRRMSRRGERNGETLRSLLKKEPSGGEWNPGESDRENRSRTFRTVPASAPCSPPSRCRAESSGCKPNPSNALTRPTSIASEGRVREERGDAGTREAQSRERGGRVRRRDAGHTCRRRERSGRTRAGSGELEIRRSSNGRKTRRRASCSPSRNSPVRSRVLVGSGRALEFRYRERSRGPDGRG